MCNLLKDPSTSGTLVAHTAPQYSHTDKWELSGNTLTRTHGSKDRPVGLEDLADERTTFLEYEDGSKETLVDNWREVENPKERSSQRFVGKTAFKLKSAPTGKGVYARILLFLNHNLCKSQKPQNLKSLSRRSFRRK